MSDAAYTHPAQLKAALTNLPILDFSATAPVVQEALATIQRQELKPSLRLELLEPLLLTACQILAAHGRGQGHGADAERLRQQRLREISLIFAEIFRSAQYTTSFMGQSKWTVFQRAQPLADALHLALRAISRLLFCGYLQYAPGSRNLWKDLYDTYAWAEKTGNLHTPVSQPTAHGGSVTSTCARTFIQTLLIAMADPHRMSPEVLWETDQQLFLWAELARILPSKQQPQDFYGIFVLDPNQPGPPVRPERVGRDADPSACRLLDCRPLIGIVEVHLKLIESGRSLPKECTFTPATARRVLPQILKGLTAPRARRETRQRTEGNKWLAFGAAPAHYFISGLRPFAPSYRTDLGIFVDDGETAVSDEVDLSSSEFQLQEWVVFDASPNGFCIYSAETDHVIRIGDLLLLALPDRGRGSAYALGATRWQICQTQAVRKLGIEILSENVRAIAMRAASGTPHDMEPRRAFLLDGEVGSGKTTVVVTGSLYQPQRELCLEIDGEWVNVQSRALVDSTDFFERFTIRTAGDETPDLESTRPLSRA
jgi:hypothetical protein